MLTDFQILWLGKDFTFCLGLWLSLCVRDHLVITDIVVESLLLMLSSMAVMTTLYSQPQSSGDATVLNRDAARRRPDELSASVVPVLDLIHDVWAPGFSG